MKKFLSVLMISLFIFPLLSLTSCVQKEAPYFGIMIGENGQIIQGSDKFQDIVIHQSNHAITGSFTFDNQACNLSADLTHNDAGIDYYYGSLSIQDEVYNLDVIKAESGMSLLFYDDSRADPHTILLAHDLERLNSAAGQIQQ